MPRTFPVRAVARLFAPVLVLAASVTLVGPTQASAQEPAATSSQPSQSATEPQARKKQKHHRVSRGKRVLRIARSKRGTPYRYGAAGPRAFDCSGYTQWVYRHVGEKLPHNSAAQTGRVRRVGPKQARVGDLVFFRTNGRVSHVGIYAGKHAIWHSPYSGQRVRREQIWSRNVFYGRVR